MSDEENTSSSTAAKRAANEPLSEQPVADEHTTAPNSPQQDTGVAPKWEMPKPVFQKTSGYLPQGYVTDMQEAARANPDNEETTLEQPVADLHPAAGLDLSAGNFSATPAPAAAVEPQPELPEELLADEPATETAPEPQEKSGGVRTSMIVLGLIAILAFLGVFLFVIVYLFFPGFVDTSPF